MLQSMGSQRVGHDLATEEQQPPLGTSLKSGILWLKPEEPKSNRFKEEKKKKFVRSGLDHRNKEKVKQSDFR